MKLECSTQISTQLIEPGGSHPRIAPIKKPAKAGFNIGTTEWIDNFSLGAVVTCCAGSS